MSRRPGPNASPDTHDSSDPGSGSPFPPGHRIAGRYLLGKALASGSTTFVFEGVDLEDQRRVAVKLLHPQLCDRRDVVLRFEQEARCAAALHHPNIVEVLGSGCEPSAAGPGKPEIPYLIEELLEGRSLRSHVDHCKQLRPAVAVELVLPVAAALELLHRTGIVHRDVKPDNIFLAGPGEAPIVKLLDFGLSKVKSGPRAVRTSARTLLGSPLYAAPEQLRGDPGLDGRADQWALGVVLFELVAGQCPFRAKTLYVLIAQVLDNPAPRLDRIMPGTPRELADLVARMLEREPGRRHPSMHAVQEALIECSEVAAELGGPAALRERYAAALAAAVAPGAARPFVSGEGRPRSGWLSRLWSRRGS